MSSVVVLDHIFCWNTTTFKMITMVDANAKDAFMGINWNYQETVGIKKSDITDDQ